MRWEDGDEERLVSANFIGFSMARHCSQLFFGYNARLVLEKEAFLSGIGPLVDRIVPCDSTNSQLICHWGVIQIDKTFKVSVSGACHSGLEQFNVRAILPFPGHHISTSDVSDFLGYPRQKLSNSFVQ
jgi:hypothetical protein